MTPNDQNLIRHWAAGLDTIPVIVLASADDDDGTQFESFCDRFKELAPTTVIKPAGDNPVPAPAIVVGPHGNVAYQAIPAGRELDPFLEILAMNGAGTTAQTPTGANQLDRLDLPVLLKLYISPHCPHCPMVARQLLHLAASSSHIRLTIVDAEQFIENARQDQVRAVPTLILDDQFRWTGQVDTGEVIKMAINRDPAKMSADSLRQLIEAGQAPRVADMMVEHNKLFPALIDLIVDEKWPIRLGAMVTVEYLAADTPRLAGQLVAPLWERFENVGTPVQGDLTYLFGVINTDDAAHHLREIVAATKTDEVREAALEALAGME